MIKIINVNKAIRELKLQGPVISPQIFMGKSKTFHPQGLFSEKIFGLDASIDRRRSMSWIDLNCEVIQPMLFDRLSKRIDRKVASSLLSLDSRFSLSEEGYLVEDPNGEISGFKSFYDNIDKIRFRKDEEYTERNEIIDMFYKYIKQKNFFTNKLLVISPEFREVTILENTNEIRIDPMNELYQRVLYLSNQLKGVSGSLYDIFSYKMQLLLKDLLQVISVKISKKSGMIRHLILGRRVDFSSRGVISPNPNLRIGEIGVPFRIVCSIFEPALLYGLVNSKEALRIPEEFHKAVKQYLGKELESELIL
jgi:hypothetical protein